MYLTEYLQRKVKSDQVGNFIFWVTFCVIGQPISIILYYHDWLLINRPEWCATVPRSAMHLAFQCYVCPPVGYDCQLARRWQRRASLHECRV